MRRAIATAFATSALAVAALAIGVTGAVGESGPACADITGETHGPLTFWNSSTGEGTLNVQLQTRASACKQVTYTLAVSGVINGPIVQSQKGENATSFVVNYTDTDNKVCISATTSAGGGKTHDAAPDSGCIEIVSGTSGGASGFS